MSAPVSPGSRTPAAAPAPGATPALAGPPRPRFIEDASSEKLWDVVVSLSTELAATRARLDALERILTERGSLPPEAIEHWQPSTAAAVERTHDLQDYTRRVFGALPRE